jgi:hypothetical protein
LEFERFSHRHAEELLNSVAEYKPIWQDLEKRLAAISEEMIIEHFKKNFENAPKQTMSLSKTINALISEALGAKHSKKVKKLIESEKLTESDAENLWVSESEIFGKSVFGMSKWRLDFARKIVARDESGFVIPGVPEKGISIEVAFNNAGSAAWNVLKPSIASELNHVKKNIQTSIAVVIVATNDLKSKGGFDSTVGTFESYKIMLEPLQDIVKVPMLIMGIKAPETFKVEIFKRNGKNQGRIVML